MVEKQDVFIGAIQVAQVLCEQVNVNQLSPEKIKTKELAYKIARIATDIAIGIHNGLDELPETL